MSKYILTAVVTALIVGAGVAIAQPMTQNNLAPLKDQLREDSKRPCIFESGGWAEADCSAGAAYSVQLNGWSRYIAQPNSGDAYFAMTTAGSGQDADNSDGYIPEGEWLIFLTTDSLRYFSCDGSAGAATVRYIECR